jgi:hypothetical protein
MASPTPLSLATILRDYLSAYEGHTVNEIPLLLQLKDQIKQSTMSEIVTEYDKLTVQKLWYSPIVATFSDELLSRMADSTFMISTAWKSPNASGPIEWEQYVTVQIGYEDAYYVLDSDNLPIHSDGWESFSLMNDSFSDEDQLKIQRIILMGAVEVTIVVSGGKLEIVSIQNPNDPVEKVRVNPRFLTLQSGETTSILAKIIDSDGFDLIRRTLSGIRNGFQVIDYWPIDVSEPESESDEDELADMAQ